MKANDKEKLEKWISQLSETDKNRCLSNLIDFLISVDYIHYYPENSEEPYWESCGDSIIDGEH